MSVEPIVGRLRAAFDERERIAVPATRRLYPDDPAVGAMIAEVLRTIQAHRKIIAVCVYAIAERDAGSTADWNRAVDAEHVLRDLASIYFPESDG